jgi:4-hydroxy-4-methyl-2-oxoglutarate aldolase
VDFGEPVAIGGHKILPGDLVHGDIHGVQTIPLEIASEIPQVAARLLAEEHELIELCRDPGFSLEKLAAKIRETNQA